MGNRVDASMVIGGTVKDLDALIEAIEEQGCEGDWDQGLNSYEEILEHLKDGTHGVMFSVREQNGGAMDELKAECDRQDLSYRYDYDGYGGEWGPGREVRLNGAVHSYSLDGDGGRACVSADTIKHEIKAGNWRTVEDVLGYLEAGEAPMPDLVIPHPLIQAVLKARKEHGDDDGE